MPTQTFNAAGNYSLTITNGKNITIEAKGCPGYGDGADHGGSGIGGGGAAWGKCKLPDGTYTNLQIGVGATGGGDGDPSDSFVTNSDGSIDYIDVPGGGVGSDGGSGGGLPSFDASVTILGQASGGNGGNPSPDGSQGGGGGGDGGSHSNGANGADGADGGTGGIGGTSGFNTSLKGGNGTLTPSDGGNATGGGGGASAPNGGGNAGQDSVGSFTTVTWNLAAVTIQDSSLSTDLGLGLI